MTQFVKLCMVFAVTATASLVQAPTPTEAGVITRACLQSGRSKATQSTCSCIQKVANKTLSARERRTAAKLFSDPHKAQEIRQSDRRSHEVFWKNYKAFGAAAERSCS